MQRARTILRRLRDRGGQTMTEYSLILVTVVAVCISLYNTSGVYVKAMVNQICGMM